MPTCVCLHVMLRDLMYGFGTGLHFGSGGRVKSVGFILIYPRKNVSPSQNGWVAAVAGFALGLRISRMKARNAVDFLDCF